MRALLQRVESASVEVEGQVVGACGRGFLILLGVGPNDTEETAQRLWTKILKLRVFADKDGKTNLSLAQVAGEVLVVSQFTLYADCRKGNRPSFVKAGAPDHAQALYEYIIRKCKESVPNVQQGIFGAYMHVSLTNEGPFTVIMDSKELGYEA